MAIPRQPGLAHNNGAGVEPMEQFDKICHKLNNTLRNLEFTRDMLKQLADNERQSSKLIFSILDNNNKRKKGLKFSKVDENIQQYWQNEAITRDNFANTIYSQLLKEIDEFIAESSKKRKILIKNNKSVQNQFDEAKKQFEKHRQQCKKAWKTLDELITKNEKNVKANRKVKELRPTQEKVSKAFEKFEAIVTQMNELEMENHEQSCDACELIHKSQVLAGKRLEIHYKNAISNIKLSQKFVSENEQMITYSPSKDVLFWKWISYPKCHHSSLPCSPKEVFNRNSLVTRFETKKLTDFQKSKRLTRPNHVTAKSGQAHTTDNNNKNKSKSSKHGSSKHKHSSSKHSSSNKHKNDKTEEMKDEQKTNKPKSKSSDKHKNDKNEKSEKIEKMEKKKENIENDEWADDFGFENNDISNNNNNNNNNGNDDLFGDTGFGFETENEENKGKNDIFGDSNKDDDIFGSSNNNNNTTNNDANDVFGNDNGFDNNDVFGNNNDAFDNNNNNNLNNSNDIGNNNNDSGDVFGDSGAFGSNDDAFGNDNGFDNINNNNNNNDNNNNNSNDTNDVFGNNDGFGNNSNDVFGDSGTITGTPTGATVTAGASVMTGVTGVTGVTDGQDTLGVTDEFDFDDNKNSNDFMADAFDEEDNEFEDDGDIVFPEFTETNTKMPTTDEFGKESNIDPFDSTFGTNNAPVDDSTNFDSNFGAATETNDIFANTSSVQVSNENEDNPFGDLASDPVMVPTDDAGANPFDV